MTYKKTTQPPELCLNCGEKVPGWRRFFCCDGCRSEYHQRGQKPRPIPTRPPGVCHCGCGKKLIGRQTRWHSDACRKKVKREQVLGPAHPDTQIVRDNYTLLLAQLESG